MNLPNPTIANHEITVTLMLEPQTSGRFVASAVEFPAFRIEAAAEAEAIDQLQQSLSEHVAHTKVMPWVISVPPIDDADFAAIVDEMRAERKLDDESEIDPAYYLEA